ncbi:CaiB/BaiF CoA transferase family protein [Sphingomonas bacterium]|uniref:CaiB/BaiF CoA transferase family protein n=1 Tax=Sphingomonas bacterium TaxID=1895847 RepID=UPI001C2D2DF4|nr:CaiB/BaiF CoA-transferase family protein [Sphingomonas bacterium]
MSETETETETGSGPLAGLRIVEFAGIGPAPFAAMLLADLGATVVRIERPGETGAFEVLSRGKTSVAADLKTATDRELVEGLCAGADAIVEGYRPGVMERLGLGPDVLLARNPNLVYARMTGWGQTGPLAQAAGHDINYIAITGALDAIGPADAPVPPLNLVGDYAGGSLYLVMGILAALLAVRGGARGQVVDCAIVDGAASLMAVFAELKAHGRWRDGRERNFLDGAAPFYRTYACADGLPIAFGALEPHFYARFRVLAGADDPVFDLRDDETRWPSLRARFAELFATRTRAQWCALLEGTDACFAPVLPLGDAPSHPHLVARETFFEMEGIVQPAPAPRFSATPSPKPIAARPAELRAIAEAWLKTG